MSTPESSSRSSNSVPDPPPAPAPAPASRRARPPKVLRWTDLLLGLLPVIGAGALVGVLLWENTRPLTPRYEARLKADLAASKFGEAQACVQRLLTLHPERADLKFTLAELYARAGRFGDADRIVRDLARPDVKGFMPAHVWLATRLLPLVGRSPEATREAEGHLKILLTEAPNAPELKVALGKLYAQTRRPKEAVGLLAEYAKDDPTIQMTLARCWDATGSREQAARYRAQAIETCRKLSESRPKEPLPWILWAQAVAQEGEYAAALAVLDRGAAAVAPHALDRARGELCSEWATKAWKNPPKLGSVVLRPPTAAETAEPLRIILLGLAADPSHPRLTDQLTQIAVVPGEAGNEARRILDERAKLGGTLGAVARLVLGNLAYVRKDPDEARRQWALGFALDPELPVLANNYAYSMATSGPSPDPARALTIIDAVMKRDDRDPRLRFTRGDLLARLGRDAEAEADLTRALADGCADPELPRVLENVRTRRRANATAAPAVGKAGPA